MKEFLTINENCENIYIIEKSKFICYLSNCGSDSEAKEFIDLISKNNYDATHNCYAYIVGTDEIKMKFSDDGEPSGTAGMPILEVLKKNNLTNIVAVVTRYFGGKKLGAGGLVRAYSTSVSLCIERAKIICKRKCKIIKCCIEFDMYSKILNFFCDSMILINTNFNNNVELEIAIVDDCFEQMINKLNNAFCGKFNYTIIKEDFVGIK